MCGLATCVTEVTDESFRFRAPSFHATSPSDRLTATNRASKAVSAGVRLRPRLVRGGTDPQNIEFPVQTCGADVRRGRSSDAWPPTERPACFDRRTDTEIHLHNDLSMTTVATIATSGSTRLSLDALCERQTDSASQ